MNYRSLIIATAQASVFYLSGFVIPLIGQVLILFTPVPFITLALREGRREAFIALMASCGIVALLGGWQLAASLVICFGAMATGTSESMRKQMRVEYTALIGGLLPLSIVVVGVVFYSIPTGKNPIPLVEEHIRQNVAQAASVYTKLGLIDAADVVNSLSADFVYYFVRLLPGILIATFVTQAALCYGIARAALIRKPGKATLPQQNSFALWHAPDIWVWGLIAALGLLALPAETIRLAGWNLAIVFVTLYLAQGMALLDHFLRKLNLHTAVRTVLICLMLAMPPLIAGTAVLGVVDIWADFRKVRLPQPQ